MTTQFTTTVTNMYTVQQPSSDYVVNVLWKVTGVDGDHVASDNGNTQFDFSQQEGPVIPYNELTESVVLGWIPADQIASVQQYVQSQIDNMITPPVTPANTPLPWGVP